MSRHCAWCSCLLPDRRPGQAGALHASCSERCREMVATEHKRSYHVANADRDNDRSRRARADNREARSQRDSAYYQSNRSVIREKQRIWRLSRSPQQVEAERLAKKIKYALTVDRAKEAAYRAANRKTLQERQRLSRLRNPTPFRHRERAKGMIRRAIKRGVFAEAVSPATVFELAGGICGICGSAIDPSEKWHVDHIEPLSKGGAHTYDNVQPSHAQCNLAKGSKVPSGQGQLFRRAG